MYGWMTARSSRKEFKMTEGDRRVKRIMARRRRRFIRECIEVGFGIIILYLYVLLWAAF